MSATVTITGDRQLDAKLRALPIKVQKKLGGQAIRAGLRVQAKVIRQQVGPRDMRRAVGSRYKASGRNAGGMVGTNVGKKKGRGWVPHFGIYVTGTRNRYTKRGAYRGQSPAHPVVDEGIAIGGQKALDATIQNLKAGILREANR